jgi:predicted GH43/DUF377 family glycosyl hydrolase
MHWNKLGLIFRVDQISDWIYSHASWPKAINLGGDIFRIFFSPRDKLNRSHIAFVDINILSPYNILNMSKEPVLSPGKTGSFDDSGVIPCTILKEKKTFRLYYMGMNLPRNIPYCSFSGLALINNQLTKAKRFQLSPLIDRNRIEPYSGGASYVMKANNLFHMWYESAFEYDEAKQEWLIILKYAKSEDGINWKRCSKPIDLGNKSNYISTPSVIYEKQVFKIWYSFKNYNNKYRIGYAESLDGIKWENKDEETGIDVSETGWDSDQICYPYVFDHESARYMLYNGNDYGKTGFGLAVLENG